MGTYQLLIYWKKQVLPFKLDFELAIIINTTFCKQDSLFV